MTATAAAAALPRRVDDVPWWGRPLLERRVRAGGIAVAAVVALAVPGRLGPGDVYLVATAVADAVAVLSIVLLTGMAGQLSLAQAGFMGTGALTAAHLASGAHLPFLLAVPLGALAAVPVGMVAAIPALRVSGIQLAVVTLAYGQLLQRLFFDAPINGGTLGGVPLHRPGLLAGDAAYCRFEIAVFAACAAAVTLLATRRTGRNLTLLRESETAALAAGVNLVRAKLAAFALSAFIAGLAGALLAGVSGVASPASFGPYDSIGLLAVGVIGGLTNAVGAAAAGLLRACGPAWLAHLPLVSGAGDIATVVFGAGLVLSLLTAPRGVAGQVVAAERAVVRHARRALGARAGQPTVEAR